MSISDISAEGVRPAPPVFLFLIDFATSLRAVYIRGKGITGEGFGNGSTRLGLPSLTPLDMITRKFCPFYF